MNRKTIISDYFQKNDLALYLSFFVLFFIVFSFFHFSSQETIILSFGAEYESIARSIVNGKGYANPFFEVTGKTAWMPPTLVMILASTFFFIKDRLIAFVFLSVIKVIAYCLSIYWIYKIFQKCNLRYFLVFYSCFLLYFLFSPDENFGRISDLWLAIVLQSAFLYVFFNYRINKSRTHFGYLMVVLFLAPLTSPALAIGFVTVIAYFFFEDNIRAFKSNPGKRKQIRKIVLASAGKHAILATAFLSSVVLWGLRNYHSLGEFIPTKSNMWFEFYQANVIDYDGCLSYSTLDKIHPIQNPDIRDELRKMGEAEWIAKYEKKSKEFVREHREVYIQKTLNRIINAFVFAKLDMDSYPSEKSGTFSETDLSILQKQKYLKAGNWLTLEMKPGDFKTKIDKLPLKNKTQIFEDWKTSRQMFLQDQKKVTYFLRSVFMSGLITFCSILLMLSNYRKSMITKSLLIIYITYLVPYILISHLLRYQRPLYLIQAIVLALILSEIIKWIEVKLTWLLKALPH